MNIKNLLHAGGLVLVCGAAANAQDATPVNVLLNKSVIEVAGNPAADSEGPDKLLDGDYTTKYCIIQSSPYVVIDAKGYFSFTGFKFYDCKTNEDEENASAYTIQLSMDGNIWETVADVKDVAAVDLKEFNLDTPVKARFVRFAPQYRNCARMWELEGYGTDATSLTANLVSEPKLELNTGDETDIKVAFAVKGDRASDFACNALCDKANLEVGTPVEADGVFSIPVKAVAKGSARVVVKVVNAGEVSQFEVAVRVKSSEPVSTADAVAVSNWTEDMIAESLSADSYTDGILAGYIGTQVLYSAAVSEDGAICDEEGIVEVPTSGNVYLIPVAAKNTLMVERNDDPVSLTPVEPVPTEKVNLLVFADTESALSLSAVVKYDDESEEDPVVNPVSGWKYSVEDGLEAITGLGVVEDDGYGDGPVLKAARDHRVYEISLPANQYKNVKAVELSCTGGRFGDALYVIGMNAHNVNGVVTKHLDASLAESPVKVKAGSTANVVVNYTLTDVEGLTDELTYSATPGKSTISLGEIVHDQAARTLTIPVEGITPSVANVDINLAYGTQSLKLVAQVLVKTVTVADSENCVEISSWKHDVIAEGQPASQFASQKLDNDGWVFFTDDVHPEGAIAGDERLIVAESGNVYQLAPYDGNNATMILGYGAIDAKEDLVFAKPIYTEQVNLLLTSANGNSNVDLIINYEDGTSSPVQNFGVDDWHAAEADGSEAVYGLGRVNISSGDIASERRFRLFEISAAAERDSKVKSVTVNNRGYQSYLTLLGVNAQDRQTSGIAEISAARTVSAYYDLQGRRVDAPVAGLYLVRYTDGSCAKLYVK